MYRVSCPIGVLLIVFEARPEVVVQISCLAIKSGNAVILKGGKEASYSNTILNEAIQYALQSYISPDSSSSPRIPPTSVQLVSTRDEIATLLSLDDQIDLVIPRGSNQLVKYIQGATRIPVLGHADGICSVFVDSSASLIKTIRIVVDAKINYPAACNSAETLLVHRSVLDSHLPSLAKSLETAQVIMHCDPDSLRIVLKAGISGKFALPAQTSDFKQEWLSHDISVKVVESLEEAIQHINTHGSGHTESIITESIAHAEQFMAKVDSAGVYHNASTRFADGYRYGFGAEVGVRLRQYVFAPPCN